MADSLGALVRQELDRRRLAYVLDPVSGRYTVHVGEHEVLLSLDNLVREYARERDVKHVQRFLDSALGKRWSFLPEWTQARRSVLFCLEPSNFAEPPEIRTAISDMVDRVPVLLDDAGGTLQWIDQATVQNWGVSIRDIETAAIENVSAALAGSTVEWQGIDGVRLGYFNTPLPFKSPLLLAPNLKPALVDLIGWPVYAVVPDRDFVYVWSAEHQGFAERVGGVVLREYEAAPYPVSTELFEISDDGVSAVGKFAA